MNPTSCVATSLPLSSEGAYEPIVSLGASTENLSARMATISAGGGKLEQRTDFGSIASDGTRCPCEILDQTNSTYVLRRIIGWLPSGLDCI